MKRASRRAAPAPFVPPYPPSWFDRLRARLDRARVSPYVVYALVALVLFVLLTLVQWREGAYPVGEVRAFHILFAAWLPFMLALMHYLDHVADRAFEKFRPSLSATPDESLSLRYRLTTLPAAPAARLAGGLVLVNTLLVLVDKGFLRPAAGANVFDLGLQLLQIAPTPLSIAVVGALLLGVWWISGTFLYHTFHQLRVISRIYARHTLIRLLHLGPLYSFSRVTQQTTIGILAFFYMFSLSATGFRSQPGFLIAGGILFAAVAAITFASPLVGIHDLLVSEKDRLLEANTRRLEAGIADLHQQMDRRDLSGMDDLSKALASLDLERTVLSRIPTWPWEPGTLRGLVAALLIPVLIWAIQLGAGRLLP
ncbi:MAG TPA: hypothetical protein VLD63_00105 [Anaerolineales bacterium]|nr:hypothetical protein [Anaerolineales bacterium]